METNMSTIGDSMSLKDETDGFRDLPAVKKFICGLCGFIFSKERYLTNHFNFCKKENPEHRLGPGTIILQSEPSKEQGQSAELLDQGSTNEPTFGIKIELELDFTETISDTSCPQSEQPVEILQTAVEPTQHEEHIKAHERPEKPYKTNKCVFNTAQRKNLKLQKQRHTRKQSGKVGMRTGQKSFNCQLCDYSCIRRDKLQRHMLKHAGEKTFKCELCDYASRYRGNLQRHMLMHARETTFKCEICDHTTTYRDRFHRHMLKHTGEKTFNCEMCDYVSTRRDHCQRHMLTMHTGEKPFHCEICDYSSAHRDSFKRHVLNHTGKKTFNCEKCDYSSTGRYTFQQHILKHTGQKTFKCELCDYVSKRRNNLQQHMLKHTWDKAQRLKNMNKLK